MTTTPRRSKNNTLSMVTKRATLLSFWFIAIWPGAHISQWHPTIVRYGPFQSQRQCNEQLQIARKTDLFGDAEFPEFAVTGCWEGDGAVELEKYSRLLSNTNPMVRYPNENWNGR